MGKLNCRPGDLAVVIQDEKGCEANIGRVVVVRGPVGRDWRGYDTWLISPHRQAGYVWIDRKVDDQTVFAFEGEDDIEHPDRWLMPLPRSHAYRGRRRARAKPVAQAARELVPQRRLVPHGLRWPGVPAMPC